MAAQSIFALIVLNGLLGRVMMLMTTVAEVPTGA